MQQFGRRTQMLEGFDTDHVALPWGRTFSVGGTPVTHVSVDAIHGLLELGLSLGLVMVVPRQDGTGQHTVAHSHVGASPVTGYEMLGLARSQGWDEISRRFRSRLDKEIGKRKAEAQRTRGPAEKRPWSTMGVNNIFRIEVGSEQPKITTVRVACSVKGRKLGRKFLCHQYPDGTIEVWRKS